MLWYRGGVYKLLQLLALAVPTAAWAVATYFTITCGIDANRGQHSGSTESVRGPAAAQRS